MDQSKQGGGETREDKIDGTLLQEREVSYGFNSCSYLIWAEEQGLGPLQPEVVGLLGGGTQGPVTWPYHSGPWNIRVPVTATDGHWAAMQAHCPKKRSLKGEVFLCICGKCLLRLLGNVSVTQIS